MFEEFFFFQVGLQIIRTKRRFVPKALRPKLNDKISQRVRSILPFRPTQAQERVLKEIVEDLCSQRTMNRLLQGDVGSGKTIVAIQAIVLVIENGYQAALMAPTELLAEQHYRNVLNYFKETPYEIAILTSKVQGRERARILGRMESGEVDLIVGTHALIQQGVRFKTLGFVVIDEQHRFGVVQRSQLMAKGSRPDTLVMTATPIPRSLALTVYGDLDLSVLDELPPGRVAVKTVLKTERSRMEVYSVLRQRLKQGHQIYIVYPLVEESEKVDLRAASEMSEHLQKEVFPTYRVGLMHGQLPSSEKEELMSSFRKRQVHILVSTTVIEVGIDVPNASVIVVEHAERFGLSQLHQLRGRIGRGTHPSLCILLVDRVKSKEAYKRLDIMRRSNDGFVIAEKDLEIRGPGEFAGTRQSGIPDFRFGNIVRDRKFLELARWEAEGYLRERLGTGQDDREELALLANKWKSRYGLFEVG
jgi:ATP-dependent DNA helicase RecG